MSGADLLLLSLLLVAHAIGDFSPLSTAAMRAAKSGNGPVALIGAHAGVHALLVVVACVLARAPWDLVLAAAGIELATHFAIDDVRMLAGRRYPVIQDPTRDPFWYVLGVDQLAHGVVLMAIAVLVR